MEKDLRIGILNEIYGALLTENQRNMIHSYYDRDLSLGEIAQNNGISRQAVLDSVAKGREALLAYENKLGMKSKFDSIRTSLYDCMDEKDFFELKRKLCEIISEI